MKEKVILSMTTVPNRLNNSSESNGIGLALSYLTNMTYDNYEIHLNIPVTNKKTNEEYIIPEWLLSYRTDIVKIFRCTDFGSITKIIPTLDRIENPEQIIITVDDDLEYMDGFIEYHLLKRKQYPDSAIGFAGISAIDGSSHFCTTVKNDVRVKVIEGYKTVSYKRNFFGTDFNEFANKSWSDDITISAYLGKNNIMKFVVAYDLDDNFTPRVESFPCVRILPNEQGGCWEFRNEGVGDNHEEFYALGYLEK
jgi:hypothetical protein